MATNLSVPKVSITSTDSGYDSKNQSKSNIIDESNDNTVQPEQRSKEEVMIPPKSLNLLSPLDHEHERHRASSTGSNVSSHSSNVSTPDSTKPLLSRSTKKEDHHLLSPNDYVQDLHRVRKNSTGSNASSCCSSDVSTPGSTQPLLSDQSTSKSKGQDRHLLSPNDYVQEAQRARKSSTSSSYSSDVSTPGSTRSLLPDQSVTKSKEQEILLNVEKSTPMQVVSLSPRPTSCSTGCIVSLAHDGKTTMQDATQQKSRSSEMTYADEKILCDTIRCEMPTFVNNTDCKILSAHIHSRNLLHPSDYETLTSTPSNTQKGNYLYMHILPHKGEHAYRLVYECLENEKQHTGHKDLVNILDKALNDGHPPQSSGPTDSSSGKLNYTDEIILRKSVCCEMPRFVDNSDFNTLSSHLYSRNLVHSSDYETLISMRSDKERGDLFYMQILPRKGRHAYRRLYKCLKHEREHMGHRDLVEILDQALKDKRPSHSDDSSTEEDEPETSSTHSQTKLCCRIQ